MKPALQAYIEGLVGGQFTVQLTTVAVAAAVTKLVDKNFERMALIIINTGGAALTVLPATTVSATNGVILNANGGSMTENAHDDLALVGWEHFGFGGLGGTNATVMEIIRYNSTPQPGGS